jgi:hypothetical protein
MAYATLIVMVLRIPAVKYFPEYYTTDSKKTREMVLRELKKDRNIIDFYAVG